MTVHCQCGLILVSDPDPVLDDQRELRIKQGFGAKIANHIAKDHPEQMRVLAMNTAMCSGFFVMGMVEGDEEFTAWREQSREAIAWLFAPKGTFDPDPPAPAKRGLLSA